MKIEVWSDVVCPWCYIGKRHLEAALAGFEHAGAVRVTWKSYQLDPSAPQVSDGNQLEHLMAKYRMSREQAEAAQARVTGVAAAAGLEYHLDRARSGNTFDAHRLIHLAATAGLQDAMKERLMAAYFTEGASIGDHAELQRLGEEVGLPGERVAAVLATEEFAAEVRADIEEARMLGISGVPFFVIERRYGISGAQPAAAILEVLRETWNESAISMVAGGEGAVCEDDSCAVPQAD